MSDSENPQDWMKDWQALQQQYWNAWSDATHSVAGDAPDARTPWHEGVESWMRLLADSGKQSETADRVLGSAKAYVALLQSMFATVGGSAAQGNPMQAWVETVRNGFDLPGGALSDNPLAGLLRGISGPGVKSFDSMAAAFAPMFDKMRQEELSWLQVPAFGYSREHQQRYQQAMAALAEYQDALGKYNALIMQSSRRSFEILEGKLAERAEPGRQIDSMRALYDLWVDAAEEAYAEITLSDEFSQAYGNLVNAQMRVRAKLQQEAERVCAELGLPTRTELNSVHRRLHDMRASGGRSDPAEMREMAAEIARLRGEVDGLNKALGREQQGSHVRASVSKATRTQSVRQRVSEERARSEPRGSERRFSDALQTMRSGSGAAKPTKRKSQRGPAKSASGKSGAGKTAARGRSTGKAGGKR